MIYRLYVFVGLHKYMDMGFCCIHEEYQVVYYSSFSLIIENNEYMCIKC